MAQHVELVGWLHVLLTVPVALATTRVVLLQHDAVWLERALRGSLEPRDRCGGVERGTPLRDAQ